MRRNQIALVLLLVLVVSPAIGGVLRVLGGSLTTAEESSTFIVSGLILIGASIAILVMIHYHTEQGNDKDEGTWGIIPDWQYEGRFAEAGGLTRSEQSKEIEKIQTEAKEREEN